MTTSGGSRALWETKKAGKLLIRKGEVIRRVEVFYCGNGNGGYSHCVFGPWYKDIIEFLEVTKAAFKEKGWILIRIEINIQ